MKQSKKPPFLPTSKSVHSFNRLSASSGNLLLESGNSQLTRVFNPEENRKMRKKRDELGAHALDKYFDYDQKIKVLRVEPDKQQNKKRCQQNKSKVPQSGCSSILRRIKSEIIGTNKDEQIQMYKQELNYKRKNVILKLPKAINLNKFKELQKPTLRKKNILKSTTVQFVNAKRQSKEFYQERIDQQPSEKKQFLDGVVSLDSKVNEGKLDQNMFVSEEGKVMSDVDYESNQSEQIAEALFKTLDLLQKRIMGSYKQVDKLQATHGQMLKKVSSFKYG